MNTEANKNRVNKFPFDEKHEDIIKELVQKLDFFTQIRQIDVNGRTWFIPKGIDQYRTYQDYVHTVCKYVNLDNILNTIKSVLDRWHEDKQIFDLCCIQLAAIISNNNQLNQFVTDVYNSRLEILAILQDTIDKGYTTTPN